MRIGLVLSNVPQYSETFFISKINGLAQNGFSVFVFANGSRADCRGLSRPNVRVIRPFSVCRSCVLQVLKSAFVFIYLFVCCPKRFFRFIRAERADRLSWGRVFRDLYINAHILPRGLDWLHFGFATMGIGRENTAYAIGALSAVSFRGYDISLFPLKHAGCYSRLFLKVDKVHSISDGLYRSALALGLSREKAYMKITPAINIRHFQSQGEFSFFEFPLRILSVGRLTWKKGYEYAIEAISILRGMGIDVEYTIVGAGEDRERLLYAAYQWGVQNRVHLIGKCQHDAIPSIMVQHDFYLQPSVQEGFCNAALEAQGCGLICIVSDAEGLPENVLDGRTGFVVPKRDAQAIADVISRIIHLPREELISITRYAAKRVHDEFNLELQIKKFIRFYNEV